MILVGHQAPDFTTQAILPNGSVQKDWSFSEHSQGRYALLFFYPLDFTFVCPSELIALDKAYAKFKKRGIEVFACSIDSAHTHRAWRNTSLQEGGIGPVQYTLLSDISHQICQMYGVEHYDEKVALRGAFIIDKNAHVRSQIINDLPLGRNIEEILRTFDALAHHEKFGEVCPVDWQQGQKGMQATPEGVKAFLSEVYA